MNEESEIRMTWSLVVRDELHNVFTALGSHAACVFSGYLNDKPGRVENYVDFIDERSKTCFGFNAEEITATLPALARDFNVALATDDALSLMTDDRFLSIFERLYCRPVFSIACAWAKMGHGCLIPNGSCGCGKDEQGASRCLIGLACLRAVRQILGLYGRLLTCLPNTEVTNEILDKFVKRIQETPTITLPTRYAEVFRLLISQVDLSPLQAGDSAIRFRNGPGAVAERDIRHQWQKQMLFNHWEPRYDHIDHRLFRFPFQDDEMPVVMNWKQCQDYSKVALVPKDYRGPRIIASEPALHAYVQQGVDWMIRKGLRKSVSRYCMNLNDQTENAHAALAGSVDGSRVTIDLMDASDTVRVGHLDSLARVCPEFYFWLMTLRTPQVRVRGDLHKMTTFALMGSSLTFPVETLVFAATVISASWEAVVGRGVACRESTLKKAIKRLDLHVYGDDITLRREYAETAITALRQAGFLPNEAKCCVKGFFRESCGVDALHGHDVTPLRPRYLPGAAERNWLGYKDMTQGFLDRKCPRVASWLYHLLASSKYHVVYPICDPHDVVDDIFIVDRFGQLRLLLETQPAVQRYNRDLQRPEVKSPILSARLADPPLEAGGISRFFDLCRYRAALLAGVEYQDCSDAVGPHSPVLDARFSLGLPRPSEAGYPDSSPVIKHRTAWACAKDAFVPVRGTIPNLLGLDKLESEDSE